MSTPITAAKSLQQKTLAERLNDALAAQPETGPLDRRDACDTCNAGARAVFIYPVAEVVLCGHHMRLHLESLLDNNPTSFWIDPAEVWLNEAPAELGIAA